MPSLIFPQLVPASVLAKTPALEAAKICWGFAGSMATSRYIRFWTPCWAQVVAVSVVLYTSLLRARYAVCGSVGWTVTAKTPPSKSGVTSLQMAAGPLFAFVVTHTFFRSTTAKITLELLGASQVALIT